MINDQMKMSASTRVKISLRRDAVCEFKGEIFLFRKSDGKLLRTIKNTIQTKLMQVTAQGAAIGSMNAANKMEFFEAGPSSLVVANTSKVAGGTGSEDYITLEGTYNNSSGSTKTVTQLELGYDLGGGGEELWSTVTGLSEAVDDGDGLTVQWKLTFSLSSGDLTSAYRYKVIQMLDTGTFVVGDKINFIDTTPTDHKETASLNAGGDGTEVYHEWTATHTASGSETIDKIYYIKDGGSNYTEADIVNKALSNGEQIEAFVKITHSAS